MVFIHLLYVVRCTEKSGDISTRFGSVLGRYAGQMSELKRGVAPGSKKELLPLCVARFMSKL